MEEWRDIKEYEGLYQVSSLGRVKSLKKKKVLPFHNTSNGYYQVHLYSEGKAKYAYVHRLVADAFCSRARAEQTEVDHIDGNRKNNKADNLEWCTRQENHQTSVYFLRQVAAKIASGKIKPVEQYTPGGELLRTFYGLHDAERGTGVARPHISRCCQGKVAMAGGYIWKYAE